MELMKTGESLKVQLAELEEALLQALAQSEKHTPQQSVRVPVGFRIHV